MLGARHNKRGAAISNRTVSLSRRATARTRNKKQARENKNGSPQPTFVSSIRATLRTTTERAAVIIFFFLAWRKSIAVNYARLH